MHVLLLTVFDCCTRARQPHFKRILDWYVDYAEEDSGGMSILFPVGALRALRRLMTFSNNRWVSGVPSSLLPQMNGYLSADVAFPPFFYVGFLRVFIGELYCNAIVGGGWYSHTWSISFCFILGYSSILILIVIWHFRLENITKHSWWIHPQSSGDLRRQGQQQPRAVPRPDGSSHCRARVILCDGKLPRHRSIFH